MVLETEIAAIRLNEESIEIMARLCQEHEYKLHHFTLLFDGEYFLVAAWNSRLATSASAWDRDVNVAVLQMAIKVGIK